MPHDQEVSFGPYRFAGPQGPLWRRTQVVPLPPKALAVLWLLVRQAGQVVTKEALLQTGWPETVASDGVLTACMGTLRHALGDEAKQPRYIATVHRLGYRFVAPVTGASAPVGHAPEPPPQPTHPLLVGREAELAYLHQLFVKVRHGERQVVFVTGEAGMGKTALVDTFVERLASSVQRSAPAVQGQDTEPLVPVVIAQGQCIDHYGAGEAYLPLLDALSRLGRQPIGDEVRRVVRHLAPTWVVQLPAWLAEADYAALQPKVAGATRERMLREMGEALEALSAERVLVLVLEDVHWSDAATIDLVNWLARRQEPARLLVLVTYRPAEVIIHDHPLKQVKQALVTRGQGVEVVVGPLPVAQVQQYVRQRWTAATERAAAVVARRTEGHPLFMVQMTEYLTQHAAATGEATGLDELEHHIPQQLRDLLEVQLGQLTGQEQAILAVGSVVGAEFTVASVAAGGAFTEAAVETVCEQLVQRGQLLVEREVATWSDGTVSGRYGFRHALYQEVLYQRLSTSRRVRAHRQIGERQEVGYGERAQEMAAELAMHFERGHEWPRAVHYRYHAGRRAWERCAYQEALTHLTAGLHMLTSLPDNVAQQQHELRLQMALALVRQRAQGAAMDGVVTAFTRAHELAQRTGATAQAFEALFGLWVYTWARGALVLARQQGEQLLAMAEQEPTAPFAFHAHLALGGTLYDLGELRPAHAHFTRALAASSAGQESFFETSFMKSFGVFVPAYLAYTLWFLGYPEQALVRMREAVALAYDLGSPYSIAITLTRHVTLLQFLRAPQAAYERSQEMLRWSTSQGFPQWVAMGQVFQSWARSHLDAAAEEVRPMRQALGAWQATGARLGVPKYLGLLADVCLRARHGQDGLAVVAEAFAVMADTGERVYEAEVWRLKGELLLLAGAGEDDPQGAAAACFLQAIAVAQHQHAKALELRAVMSLVRLRRQQVTHHVAQHTQQAARTALAAAHTLLAEVYGWFTEGFDTPDLHEANMLIASAPSPYPCGRETAG